MVYCPFCNGQGVIYRANIKNTETEFFICDECDSVWKEKDINENSAISFKKIMNDSGLRALWSELENIEKI